LAAGFVLTDSAKATVTIDYVTVGDVGNAADSTGFGAVGYSYQISKYEVTNAQYAEFLNAVAATDSHVLYNSNMNFDARGGITQSGVSGSFTYSLKANMGDKPVNYVSFSDAMRFSNWMHNGQGGGSTESGAYDMTQSASTVIHSGSASVWIPTENEWYKAAYYQPVGAGGDMDSYWLYPTKSNSQPTSATPPSGISGAANYYYDDGIANGINGGYAVTQSTTFISGTTYLSDVGAYSNSSSYYGTFDQGGNGWEWNEAVIGSGRGLRGGSWPMAGGSLLASDRGSSGSPANESSFVGFRLASSVPEPSRVMLLIAGGCGLLMRRRRVPW
jgi:formylglycine-generating enzyme required for sulfatase activity